MKTPFDKEVISKKLPKGSLERLCAHLVMGILSRSEQVSQMNSESSSGKEEKILVDDLPELDINT